MYTYGATKTRRRERHAKKKQRQEEEIRGNSDMIQVSEREEDIGRKIVDAAYAVHKELGSGLYFY